MSEKHKKVYSSLNYFDHFLIFISAVSGCIPISPVGLKIYTSTSGIVE